MRSKTELTRRQVGSQAVVDVAWKLAVEKLTSPCWAVCSDGRPVVVDQDDGRVYEFVVKLREIK
jgi:hypothetical protein